MTTSKNIANGILRSLFTLAIIALLLLFVFKIKSVLIDVIISIIFSLIANPVVKFLRKRLKFKNTLAVIVTLFLFLILLAGLVSLFIPLIISQTDNLSLLNTNAIQTKSLELYTQFNQYLAKHNIILSKVVSSNDLTSKIKFSYLTDFFNSVLGTVGSFGITIATTFFISFFILKDKILILDELKKILPDEHEERILKSIEKTKNLLTRYFSGLLLQTLIIGIMYLIVLLIFGVENAFVIAFLCALLNIIPYVGPFISLLLVGILSMLGNISADFQTVTLPTTIYVLIGFFIIHLIDNNISQPIIFSKSVNCHPLEIFLVILISGVLFGITGMIIAVPSYTILKVIGKEFFPNNKIIQALTQNV